MKKLISWIVSFWIGTKILSSYSYFNTRPKENEGLLWKLTIPNTKEKKINAFAVIVRKSRLGIMTEEYNTGGVKNAIYPQEK